MLSIASGHGYVCQGMDGRIDYALHHRVKRPGHRVMNPGAMSTRFDEACPAEIRQVARRRRLRHAYRVVDVTDADLIGGNERQNAEPR